MDMEDKLSIKNVIFTKSFPNHDVPAPIEGHKIYPCIDCGDKFMFESSYNDHFDRKSMQITYLCRFCNKTQIYFNRCMLLYHIRSHTFKTATINVNDIKVEPLPLSMFRAPPTQQQNKSAIEIRVRPDTIVSPHVKETSATKHKMYACYECKQDIVPQSGINYKDRVSHYMQYTNQVHTCPVCLCTLPTVCGLRAHLRFHMDKPPFFCPECGVHLSAQKRKYPYGHDCDGFKMMRATTRLKCPVSTTQHLFHPNDFLDHMKANHLKKVYKCAQCVVACFNEATMDIHSETHVEKAKSFIFFQCELCPGKLVVESNIDNHLRTHTNAGSIPILPCWTCGSTFNDVCTLLVHHVQKHKSRHTESIMNIIHTMSVNRTLGDSKRIYRVVKRCDLCQRNFTYKCNFSEISVLPSECPFKCSKSQANFKIVLAPEPLLTCLYCNEKISQNWEDIKIHYESKHKEHKCLDLKVSVEKIDITKYMKKKRQRNTNQRKVKPKKRQVLKAGVQESSKQALAERKNPDNFCTICEITCESKDKLKTHFLSHKDPCMAYQCMECGQNFIVKPSFATHLMLMHGISNADEYISKNSSCYNEITLGKDSSSEMPLEPIKENQCKICREQFDNPEDLAKHFRGHGMAFLLKTTSNKNVP